MKTTVIAPHKSSLGMNANLTVLIAYLAIAVGAWIPFLTWIAWICPLVFFFLEKESKFVKFHSIQAIIIGIVSAVLNLIFQILYWITVPKFWGYAVGYGFGIHTVFSIISYIISLAVLLLMGYLAYMSFNYKSVELPVIGPFAEKMSAKLDNIKETQFGGGNPQNPNSQN